MTDYKKYTVKPLVLGILSVIFAVFVPFAPIAMVLGIIATIMGYKARAVSGSSGFILGIVGMAISAIVMFAVLPMFCTVLMAL
jgi:hypothetical protein